MVGTPDTNLELTAAQQLIEREVQSAAYAGIAAKVEDGKKQARNGGDLPEDANFFEKIWAAIKGFIFQLAEAFGFEKQLASMFGMPIPEEQEMQNVSAQVGQSVSRTLTDKQFTYGTKQEFEQGIKERIFHDLQANRDKSYPSFSDEQLADIARQTASGVVEKEAYATMFKKDGVKDEKAKDPIEAAVTGGLEAAFVREAAARKDTLAALAGKQDFGEKDIATISQTLAPVVLTLPAAATTQDIADKFRQALAAEQGNINHTTGAKWTAETLNILANRMAVGYAEHAGKPASEAFLQKMQQGESNFVASNIKKVIKPEVENGIVSQVAAQVTQKYNDIGWAKKKLAGFGAVEDVINNPSVPAEIREKRLYDFAVSKGYAPNDTQRARIGEVVSGAVAKVVGNKEYDGEGQQAIAQRIRNQIAQDLRANDGIINQGVPLGQAISTINKNLDGADIYADIANEFGKRVAGDPKTWKQLDTARKAMGSVAMGKALTSAVDVAYQPASQPQSGVMVPSTPIIPGAVRQL